MRLARSYCGGRVLKSGVAVSRSGNLHRVTCWCESLLVLGTGMEQCSEFAQMQQTKACINMPYLARLLPRHQQLVTS